MFMYVFIFMNSVTTLPLPSTITLGSPGNGHLFILRRLKVAASYARSIKENINSLASRLFLGSVLYWRTGAYVEASGVAES